MTKRRSDMRKGAHLLASALSEELCCAPLPCAPAGAPFVRIAGTSSFASGFASARASAMAACCSSDSRGQPAAAGCRPCCPPAAYIADGRCRHRRQGPAGGAVKTPGNLLHTLCRTAASNDCCSTKKLLETSCVCVCQASSQVQGRSSVDRNHCIRPSTVASSTATRQLVRHVNGYK